MSEDQVVTSAVKGAPARDRVLDVIRGICIVAMVSGHVAPQARLTVLMHLPFWVSAADFFMLVSGIVLGMRASRRRDPDALRELHRASLKRSLRLLWIHYVLTLLVIAVHEATGRLHVLSLAELGGFLPALWAVLTLRYQPADYMNILPMFVVLLAFAPLMVELLHRGKSLPLLAGSFALWLAAQRFPGIVPLPSPEYGEVYFSLAAWQFLFVAGAVAGFHRAPVLRWFKRTQGRILLTASGLVTLVIVAAAQVFERNYFIRLGFGLPPGLRWLVQRNTEGPVRLTLTLGLMVMGYAGVHGLLRESARRAAEGRAVLRWFGSLLLALEALGKRSLRCFVLHMGFALTATAFGSIAWPRWAAELSVLAALLCVFDLSRRAWAVRLIPN